LKASSARPWLKVTLGALASLAGALGLVVAASYFAADRKQVLATVTDDLSLPSLEIDRVKLHLETFGAAERPVLIALHGGPGNDYRHLLPLQALSDEFHVVLYDQRGAGLSERVESERLHLEALVEELDQIATHFSPKRPVHLVGHSWGGMLAAAYLERHHNRVAHLVLIEPGFLDQATADRFLLGMNAGIPKLSFALLREVWGRGFEAWKLDGPDEDAGLDYFVLSLAMSDAPGNPTAAYYCGGKPSADSFHSWRMGVRSSIAIQRAGIDADRKLRARFVDKNAKEFSGRVLILAGSCNTLIGPEHQKAHLKLFKNAELKVLPETGHMMLQERPMETQSLIREHLRESFRQSEPHPD
jgi:proline iminopeptidase